MRHGNLDLPNARDFTLAGIQRPEPGGVLIERHIGLPAERHGTGGHFRKFGLTKLGRPRLLGDIQRLLRAHRNQPRDPDQGDEKDTHRNQDFQERQAVSSGCPHLGG